jgi:phospholipase/carboxylesterase
VSARRAAVVTPARSLHTAAMQLAARVALILGAIAALGCGKAPSRPADRIAPAPVAASPADAASSDAPRPPPLAFITVGAAAEAATTTVVLLHGYGAAGDDLLDLARLLPVPATVRFVLPAAPIALDGAGTERAWWHFDPDAAGDRRDQIPVGLAAARAQVDALLDQLEAAGPQRIVLGGFSQGAMLAVDVALQRARPLAGLAVLSGTRIDGAAWRAGIGRARGLPVLISHGTADDVLPVAEASALRDQLRAAGAEVTWVEFPGGHTLADETVAQLAQLIARVAAP